MEESEITFKGSQKNVYLIERGQMIGGLEIPILIPDLGSLDVKTELLMRTSLAPLRNHERASFVIRNPAHEDGLCPPKTWVMVYR